MLWPEPPLLPPAEDFDNLFQEQHRSAIVDLPTSVYSRKILLQINRPECTRGEFLGKLIDQSVLLRREGIDSTFALLPAEVDVVEADS